VTPEAERILQRAEKHLERGQVMLGVGLTDDAGRAAYLASFHAAQAVIFERIGKVVKTHRGVQSEFLRLTKDDPHVTPEERIFLSRAYNFKAIADYDTGLGRALSAEDAILALERGRGFVDTVRRVLTPPDPA
jgi:uncharacterized protein (UPF0332 family)